MNCGLLFNGYESLKDIEFGPQLKKKSDYKKEDIENIEVLNWSAVEKARVGDIALTMKKLNRQHALVLEQPAEGTYQIRGIFSISLLSRLLGFQMDTTEVAKTFAEFERVLGCNA